MSPSPDQGPNPDQEASPQDRTGVPAAFYRDAAPPPSPNDPHWAEFNLPRDSDDLPEWLILAAPATLAGILILHGILALILALLMHVPITMP